MKFITIVSSFILFFNAIATEKIVALSIPKSGSFLLYKCIQLITDKKPMHVFHTDTFDKWSEGFVTNHELPTQKALDYYQSNSVKGVFIYRDPRDQIVSTAYFFKEKLKHPKAADMNISELFFDCMRDDCRWWRYVVFVGVDLPSDLSIASLYNAMLPWRDYDFIYSTTFEKLIGPKGGGNKKDQIKEIIAIAAHIGSPISQQRAEKIADQLFGRFETFRSGQIGAWKKEFNEIHKKEFKNIAGQLLIDLGYEKNFNW